MSKWISIYDRQPVNYSKVLFSDGENMGVGSYELGQNFFSGKYDIFKITHWMPLPAPPRGE